MSAALRHKPTRQQPPNSQQDEASSSIPTRVSTRLPTRSTSNATTAPALSTQRTPQEPQRRTSRIGMPTSRTGQETATASSSRIPGSVAQPREVSSTALRRSSAVQPADPQPAKLPARSNSRNVATVSGPAPPKRTPSTAQGPLPSIYDIPNANGLRRKPSTIGKYAAARRAEPSLVDGNDVTVSQDRMGETGVVETVSGVATSGSVPYGFQESATVSEPKARFSPNLYRQHPAIRVDTTPAPSYAPPVTPTTRYTDSPFSHAPTPSSASSYSSAPPVASIVTVGTLRHQSPVKTRQIPAPRTGPRQDPSRLPSLAPVREVSTSSSSNSTVKSVAPSTTISKRTPQTKPASGLPVVAPAEVVRPVSRGKLVKSPPKRKPSTVHQRPSPAIPPELAHLNVEPAQTKSALDKPLPPRRPSRDGTHVLEFETAIGIGPCIQVDLPRGHSARNPSQEVKTPESVSSPSLRSRLGFAAKSPPKVSSPRADSAVSSPPTAHAFRPQSPPKTAPPEKSRDSRKDSPAISTSPSPAKSPRFGFLHRKSKDDSKKTTEKPKRAPTRPPPAGQRYATRAPARPGSAANSSTSSFGFRSASTESISSSQSQAPGGARKSSVGSRQSRGSSSEMDEFLRERLNPIVLRGSGSTGSNVASAGFQQGTVPASSKTSLESHLSPQLSAPAPATNAGVSPSKRSPSTMHRVASDSSADGETTSRSALASRRSLTKLSRGESASPVRMPPPIKTSVRATKGSVDSYYAEVSAGPPTEASMSFAGDSGEGREGLWLRPLGSRNNEGRLRSPLKWNFFQRAHSATPPQQEAPEREAEMSLSSIEPSHHLPYERVAHYAMMDSVEPVGLEEVARIVHENTSPEDSMSEGQGHSRKKFTWPERRQTKLLPSPAIADMSRDSDSQLSQASPNMMVRLDSAESPELLRAQTAVTSRPATMVDVKPGPLIADLEELPVAVHSPSLLPALPVQTPEPIEPLEAAAENAETSPMRVPRLSPVGRIPKVVSRRDRDRKLSDNSFSRPFARAQPKPSVKPPGSLYNEIRELASPELGAQPGSSTSTTRSDGFGEDEITIGVAGNHPALTASPTHIGMDTRYNQEFLHIPRMNSDLSYSSSSGTHNSVLAPAPIPEVMQEDDEWKEYDEFIDDVMLHHETPLSTGSSFGKPFQYASMLYDPASPSMPAPLNWSHAAPMYSTQDLRWSRAHPDTEVLSVPQQIARFMQPSMSPLATPQTLGNFLENDPRQSTSTVFSNNRSSFLPPNRPSSVLEPGPNEGPGSVASSRRGSQYSTSASLPAATDRISHSSLSSSTRFRRDTQLLDIAKVDADSPSSKANLRFGALMTSKWLSNGSVLLSPAHNEMRLADEPRVLILDGMSRDWSYYVALSYPAAQVFSLGRPNSGGFGPTAPASTSWPGTPETRPKNHREFSHASIDAAFPWPRGFFTAIVFRFPAAESEAAFERCLSECQRVLRPGGHLEIVALDLDLNNMGSLARQAVRGLKTRLQQKDPKVSLKNLSDYLARLVEAEEHGFQAVMKCTVNTPVAGTIPRRDRQVGRAGSGRVGSGATDDAAEGSGGPNAWSREDRQSVGIDRELSFADLVDEAQANSAEEISIPIDADDASAQSQQQQHQRRPSSSLSDDEAITKMAAKVGRWWYSSCYEKSLLGTDQSIWHDENLRLECEKQGTSFRLLMCHAQKPPQGKRRTISV